MLGFGGVEALLQCRGLRATILINLRVAQLYGGYVLPGSRLGVRGGVGLVVSQWNTARGWPYQVMQFRVTLEGI